MAALLDEAGEPAWRRATEAIWIALGKDDAERERVSEAESAHLLGGCDCIEDRAAFERPLELMLQMTLGGRAAPLRGRSGHVDSSRGRISVQLATGSADSFRVGRVVGSARA
jgi:hypothetical protein